MDHSLRNLILSLIAAVIAVALLLIVVLVFIFGALENLKGVQAFDHEQTQNQLLEAKEKAAAAKQDAEIIPHAIHTLEHHLDHTIARQALTFRHELNRH